MVNALVQTTTPTAKLPTKGSEHSAGHDMHSTETKLIQPGARATIGTGLEIECPEGTCGRMSPRSGPAAKHGIHTGGGVIDRDCRGETKVVPMNMGDEPFKVNEGDRTAQLIPEKIGEEPLEENDTPTNTNRDQDGFGSAGSTEADMLNKKTQAETLANNRKKDTQRKLDPPANNSLNNQTNQPTMQPASKKTPSSVNDTSKTSMIATELWHQRMGHIGLKKSQATAKCATGMPPAGNLHPSFQCGACAMAKMTKTPKRRHESQATQPGERFHVDFGFARGPKHLQHLMHKRRTAKHKVRHAKSHCPIKTSHDGCSSHPLVTDAATRHAWIFLAKTKEPPLAILNAFLTQHGLKKNQPKFVRTDQGGEPARSTAFRTPMARHNHTVETTGADNSSQNGRGERPHRTFANMMRCMLHSSNLGSEFWSDAPLYAAHTHNRTHHSAIDKTPYEAWTDKQPSLKHTKAFGAPVIARETGTRSAKLDPHAHDGVFLRHTGTSRNIVCYDIHSGQVKIATHRTHDEQGHSFDAQHRTTASNHLVNIGKDQQEDKHGKKNLDAHVDIQTDHLTHHAAAAKLQAQQKFPIGARTQKQFDTDMHVGTMTACDDEAAHCKVQCDDGDEEEFEEHEIQDLLCENDTQEDCPPMHHSHKETLQLEMTLCKCS